MKFRNLLFGIVLARVAIGPGLETSLWNQTGLFYHRLASLASVFWALSFDVVGLTVLFVLCLEGARRIRDDAWRGHAWFVLALATGILVLRDIRAVPSLRIPFWTGCATWCMFLVLTRMSPRLFNGMIRIVRHSEPLLMVIVVLTIVQLGAFGFRAATHSERKSQFQRADAGFSTSNRPRVVWIEFDELSYRQLYEVRQLNGLSLPAFDRLRERSASFQNVLPAAYVTELAIPSVLSGRTLTAIRERAPQAAETRAAGSSKWFPFDPADTVFGDARKQHLNSSIVGWYNPYCDLFAGVVSACYQADADWAISGIPGMRTRAGVIDNALQLPESLFRRMLARVGLARSAMDSGLQSMDDCYRHILDYSRSAVVNPEESLVFVHAPVPHPPGQFDRRRGEFSVRAGTYLDNLVLSDRMLATIVSDIENSTVAANTILVVSSDHSWRIRQWRTGLEWRDEEERASEGHFDPRIPLLVAFPSERTNDEIITPLSAIRTRELVGRLLDGTIKQHADLISWATAPNGRL